ncbi:phage capsid scaffolding protein (GpO) [Shigella boydii CDC 3083-94]|uniref:Phage capsid scaffolding protein (GpO) n=2 Tax=Shigella boydii TaxID=621 RepID=B2U374_SHIB3|nr:phage capsid scaffolding protein (GpO) [Shigella boydii CDC 3083-94]
MANEKKTSRKKFRVAVSGSTVDGREISPVHLREAAENFNPDVYAARVNVEHYLSPCPSSEFSAMGDVTALSTEDITEGPLAGRTALYAEIEPTERMKQLVADGKKIYSSIELHPQFSVNGRAYLVGLAMTDTPASLGTERLKFTAQQRQAVMTFNSIQGEGEGRMSNTFKFSSRSEKNLQGINPDLVKVTRRALEISEVDFGITEGLRSRYRQKQLVATGKSQTMNSRHLTGHAVDVVAYIGSQVSWEWPLYEKIAAAFRQASRELNIPVEWGGDWKTLKDGPHFQLPHGAYPA